MRNEAAYAECQQWMNQHSLLQERSQASWMAAMDAHDVDRERLMQVARRCASEVDQAKRRMGEAFSKYWS